MTEILPFFGCCRESAVGVSRYGWVGHSSSRVGLVKAKASNETRMPPLQGNTLFEVERFPFLGDNQGGTAKCVFVPVAALGSLRDFLFPFNEKFYRCFIL